MRRMYTLIMVLGFGLAALVGCASGKVVEEGTVLETRWVNLDLDDQKEMMPTSKCKLKLRPKSGGKDHWSEDLWGLDDPRSCSFKQLVGAEYFLFDNDKVVVEYERTGTRVKLKPPTDDTSTELKCVFEITWSTGEIDVENVHNTAKCKEAKDVEYLPAKTASAVFQKEAKPEDFEY